LPSPTTPSLHPCLEEKKKEKNVEKSAAPSPASPVLPKNNSSGIKPDDFHNNRDGFFLRTRIIPLYLPQHFPLYLLSPILGLKNGVACWGEVRV
jgi:hypothetical protein